MNASTSVTRPTPGRMLTRNGVECLVGAKHSSIYRWMRDEGFPRPVKFGSFTRWRAEDVTRWMESRPARAQRKVAEMPSERDDVQVTVRLSETAHAALLFAAEERRQGLDRLLRRLLVTIAADDLVRAILDDGSDA